MKNHASLLSSVLLLLLLQGCATIDPAEFFSGRKYESDKPFRMKGPSLQAPLLSEKGEIQFAVSAIDGIHLEGAYAFSSKFGVMMNGNFVDGEDSKPGSAWLHVYYDDSTSEYREVTYSVENVLQQSSFTAGIVHYRKFGTSGRSEQIAGFGYGKTDCRYSYSVDLDDETYSNQYPFTEKRNWMNYFLQQNIGFVTPHAEGAAMARISYMRFTDQSFEESYPVEKYAMDDRQWVLQPGLKLGYGWNRVRFTLQCTFNLPLSGDVDWYSTDIKGGVSFRLFPTKERSSAQM